MWGLSIHRRRSLRDTLRSFIRRPSRLPRGRNLYGLPGSWLLYRYLEQANGASRKRMEDAVARGHIAWHALPFTWQTELLDRSTIAACLGFSKELDKRFGRTTTGAKMTDVPGHSRGLIAPLTEGGVTFLDIGVNAASTPPDVPAVFVWKKPRGASVIVMYHRRLWRCGAGSRIETGGGRGSAGR